MQLYGYKIYNIKAGIQDFHNYSVRRGWNDVNTDYEGDHNTSHFEGSIIDLVFFYVYELLYCRNFFCFTVF